MLVSILIPAFNTEKWIAETLESALSQTWRSIEIIVVDDGSSDHTAEIARRFPVRVITQQHEGAAAARNTAYLLSRGEFIQWLDADDVLAPDKIERQMAVFEQQPESRVLLSSAWARFMFRRSVAQFIPTAIWADLAPQEWLLRKMAHNLWMPPCTWLVSRELTEAAGPWDTTMCVDDDGEYFLRVLARSTGVRFVAEAKSYYRYSGGASLSRIGRSAEKMEAQWRSLALHIRHLRSFDDSPQARQACLTLLQNWLPIFIPDRPDLVESAEKLAALLGGKLESPRLSWKYDWMRAAFGWNSAKHAQLLASAVRENVIRSWDRMLFTLEEP
jgi:glycosyltransferase involved in cell wall biosynthesis